MALPLRYHWLPVDALEVSVTEPPAQKVVGPPALTVGVAGIGLTVTVVAAEAALRSCGYTPTRITTGGASDANAFVAAGLLCTNLANGTERNHEPTERITQAALQGMLDVTFALLDELSGYGGAP